MGARDAGALLGNADSSGPSDRIYTNVQGFMSIRPSHGCGPSMNTWCQGQQGSRGNAVGLARVGGARSSPAQATGAAPPLPRRLGMVYGRALARGCSRHRGFGTSGLASSPPGRLNYFDAAFISVTGHRRGPLWLETRSPTGCIRSEVEVGARDLRLLAFALTVAFRRWESAGGLPGEPRRARYRPPGSRMSGRAAASFQGHRDRSVGGVLVAVAAGGGARRFLAGVAYMLVVPGGRGGTRRWRSRRIARRGVAQSHLSRHRPPSDLVLRPSSGVAIPLALFRAFTPNDTFPVAHRHHGESAHLDVGGRRGEAIRQAMQEQLGFTIPRDEAGRARGLRRVDAAQAPRRRRAGCGAVGVREVYARNHVRADRWYKLGRTMLYGGSRTRRRSRRSADSSSTRTTRSGSSVSTGSRHRAARHRRDHPRGEYLIAMEFFEGAEEIGDADIDERVIDEGLADDPAHVGRGLAHRDIKPANLMVQDGHLRLIDVFFVQVRPSPWRQAVDLGNMMLVLALRSDARDGVREGPPSTSRRGARRSVRRRLAALRAQRSSATS